MGWHRLAQRRHCVRRSMPYNSEFCCQGMIHPSAGSCKTWLEIFACPVEPRFGLVRHTARVAIRATVRSGMPRLVLTLIAAVWGLVLLPLSAGLAEGPKRVALVIGNGAYQNVAKMPNPLKDP